MSDKKESETPVKRGSVTEGMVKKGGVNKPPSKPRPAPPSGQDGKK